MQSQTEILAKKIQALTGESLVYINTSATEMLSDGFFADHEEALEYMLVILEDLEPKKGKKQ